MKFVKTYILVILTTVIFALSIFSVSTIYTKNIDINSIENEIEEIRLKNNIPSIQASIISNNEHIWNGQFGTGEENSSFMIGSVQKIFTSTAILQLVEKGLIESLDDDINNYLSFHISNSHDKSIPVTFKMLLGHRSGLMNSLPYQFFWDTEALAYPNYRLTYNEDILSMATEEYFRQTLLENGKYYFATNWIAPPNSQYLYSPSGYVLLTYLIEEITNTSVSNYMDENIFSPLELINTGFEPENQVSPHTLRSGNLITLPLWTGRYMIRSTSSDMAKVMLMFMNDGSYNGQEILQRDSVELMKSSYPDWSKTQKLNLLDPQNFQLATNGYGLGWDRYSAGIGGHGGSVPGFQTYFLCKENLGLKDGIILMMNVNAILGFENDVDMVFSHFAQIRNILLFKTDMVSPVNQILTYIQTFGTTLLLLIALVEIQLLVLYKRRKKSSKFLLAYSISWIISFTIYVLIGLVTVNEKNAYLEFLGLICLVLGLLLVLIPIKTLKKFGDIEHSKNYANTQKIVDKGVYQYVRHPQYIGLIIISLSAIIIIQNVQFVILAILSILIAIILMKEEEKELIRLFGNEYNQYKKRTLI